jgi:hypothetical protein
MYSRARTLRMLGVVDDAPTPLFPSHPRARLPGVWWGSARFWVHREASDYEECCPDGCGEAAAAGAGS